MSCPEMTVAFAVVFSAITIAMHVRRRDLDPMARGMSHYATGPTKIPMTLGFVALSLSLAITSFNVQSMALAVAALGMATVAAVPVPEPDDPKWQGRLHAVGAMLFYLAMPPATLMLPATSQMVSIISRSLTAAVALFLVSMAVPALSGARGALQRVCFALVVAWLVAVR